MIGGQNIQKLYYSRDKFSFAVCCSVSNFQVVLLKLETFLSPSFSFQFFSETIGNRGKSDRTYGLLVTLSTHSCSTSFLVFSLVTGQLPIEKQQTVCAGTPQLHACGCWTLPLQIQFLGWISLSRDREGESTPLNTLHNVVGKIVKALLWKAKPSCL